MTTGVAGIRLLTSESARHGVTLSAAARPRGLNLKERYRYFHVPIFFVLGRYDWHVPAGLI